MTSDEGFLSVDQLVGLTAYDRDGAKVGSVEQVYRDDRTGRPEWVTVKTGLFGMKESFVPLEGARSDAEGLHLEHDKNAIKDAPRLDAGQHLDAAGEEELYAHYGMTATGSGMSGGGEGKQGAAAPGGMDTEDESLAGTGQRDKAGTTSADQAGMSGAGSGLGPANPNEATGESTERELAGAGARSSWDGEPGEEMIRSEERLRVGTQEEESGRARLHKVVVTENVTTTIPVSHEEARLVREPIRDGDAVDASIGEENAEVTLHAERPVIRKEAVAVERVHLETERVTEEQEVSDSVRKERVEYDDGGAGPGRGAPPEES
ncbi:MULTISPECIES: PRC and DUF2382 domain-containing protein [unclassified Streptomyces]|uniref:PRC and DUF2382 domain-containing protein n=1 Tax=Streptomyces evansiae TaxID=3075535 RepID=A0ABD5E358_9ACTN|nr:MULTISPECIES: PRC and DUF2382 domain-containing protein [unclassified Streptomyces]ASY35820.1 photosystem reaction center subunit H [Streptomyces sp. CLI2509]EGJ78552.1 hypothetical protein STTU_5763 [Streptomyces sp. Tu6071]MDT0415599.1 PRC and DUF2382 domain-containing protein [Streptomyces sp. DSM 41982]MDT0420575.1 PRC and DUF2382 domain-containing protein [Streptomyces sp. DSM 41859]MYX20263.1 DUF2382 domain-containing protein [Streptomyces sp. SID8380]